MKRAYLLGTLLVPAVAGLLPALAAAGERTEARRPAPKDGVVQIDNASGSIRVTGWDQNEVFVVAQLGHGATLELDGDKHMTQVDVDVEGNPHAVVSDLDVKVPRASRLQIETFAGSIVVAEVTGTVHAEVVNGSIQVSGSAREVDASSVNGSVEVSGAGTVRAESVNGPVTVTGAKGEVEASGVNGGVRVTGGPFESAHIESVNGGVEFDGTLTRHGSLSMETVAGRVSCLLPAEVSATIRASTFSGTIKNELGPTVNIASRHGEQKEVTFTVGSGEATVSLETLSGGIEINKR